MYHTDYESQPYPATNEQQQELLFQGKFSPPPTSVAHLADHVEASGAKIEETLDRLKCTHSTLFFVCGWLIMLISIYTFLGSLFSLSLIGLIESIFLGISGFIFMVLDIPGAPRWASRYRVLFHRQVRFMTKLTGKSLLAAYLGCMILVCLWPTSGRGSGFRMIFALLLSSSVLAVAVIGLFIGVRKSLKLEKIRKQIISNYRGNTNEVFIKYAALDPRHGLTFEEFRRICEDFSQGRCVWDDNDMSVIYNALDEHQKGAINEKEFSEWVAGPMSYL